LYGYVVNDPVNWVDPRGTNAAAWGGLELGAEIGSLAGPLGTIVGAAIGATVGITTTVVLTKILSEWQWKNLQDNTGEHPHDIKDSLNIPNPGNWDLYIEPDGRVTLRPKKGPGGPIDTGYNKDDLKPGGKCE
jgi:hypothetical protein